MLAASPIRRKKIPRLTNTPICPRTPSLAGPSQNSRCFAQLEELQFPHLQAHLRSYEECRGSSGDRRKDSAENFTFAFLFHLSSGYFHQTSRAHLKSGFALRCLYRSSSTIIGPLATFTSMQSFFINASLFLSIRFLVIFVRGREITTKSETPRT